MKPDLSTTTTDELLDELVSRHEVMVFVGRPKVKRDFHWQIRTTGAMHEAAGLTAFAQHEIATAGIDEPVNKTQR